MDKSCCWEGDFSALSRGKVDVLVGGVCLVPANAASRACVWLPRDRVRGCRGLALALMGPQPDSVRVMVGVLQH